MTFHFDILYIQYNIQGRLIMIEVCAIRERFATVGKNDSDWRGFPL